MILQLPASGRHYLIPAWPSLVLDGEGCLPVCNTGTHGTGLGLHVAGAQRQAQRRAANSGCADVDGLAKTHFALAAAIALHHLDADARSAVGSGAELEHARHVRTILVGIQADADLALELRKVAALAVQADIEIAIDGWYGDYLKGAYSNYISRLDDLKSMIGFASRYDDMHQLLVEVMLQLVADHRLPRVYSSIAGSP